MANLLTQPYSITARYVISAAFNAVFLHSIALFCHVVLDISIIILIVLAWRYVRITSMEILAREYVLNVQVDVNYASEVDYLPVLSAK